MNNNIAVIGGDLRIVKLIEMFVDDGFKIFTFGLENADILNKIGNIEQCSSIEEAMKNCDLVVGPIPLSSNNKDINTPFSNSTVEIQELFEKLDSKIFISGNIEQYEMEMSRAINSRIIDLLKREELAVLNTISTAEGAIQIAMEQTVKTIHGSNVLVMGFGRIGKILSKMLDGIGANVYCEARKEADLAWIKAYGYTPINLNVLDSYLDKFDCIINTIPFVVLDRKRLNLLKKECIIIDVASNPGGADKIAAKEMGIKLIWAMSLPGKVAPITSAEFIKSTIYNVIKEG